MWDDHVGRLDGGYNYVVLPRKLGEDDPVLTNEEVSNGWKPQTTLAWFQ